VLKHYGNVGVGLVRSVLAERRPLELTAKLAGAASPCDVSSLAWLFRKCLNAIGVATGFISSVRQPYRPNGHAEQDPAEDPGQCRCPRSGGSAVAAGTGKWRQLAFEGLLSLQRFSCFPWFDCYLFELVGDCFQYLGIVIARTAINRCSGKRLAGWCRMQRRVQHWRGRSGPD